MSNLPNKLIHLVSLLNTLNFIVVILSGAGADSASLNQLSSSSNTNEPSKTLPKLKRDSRAKVTSLELDTQETGYLPPAYQTADSGYGYDAGKNTYGKQASDWSLYDQGKCDICLPTISLRLIFLIFSFFLSFSLTSFTV